MKNPRIVQIRAAWRDAGEAATPYVVIEDNGDRLQIVALADAGKPLAPISLVGADMVEDVPANY